MARQSPSAKILALDYFFFFIKKKKKYRKDNCGITLLERMTNKYNEIQITLKIKDPWITKVNRMQQICLNLSLAQKGNEHSRPLTVILPKEQIFTDSLKKSSKYSKKIVYVLLFQILLNYML